MEKKELIKKVNKMELDGVAVKAIWKETYVSFQFDSEVDSGGVYPCKTRLWELELDQLNVYKDEEKIVVSIDDPIVEGSLLLHWEFDNPV